MVLTGMIDVPENLIVELQSALLIETGWKKLNHRIPPLFVLRFDVLFSSIIDSIDGVIQISIEQVALTGKVLSRKITFMDRMHGRA
jgi:hypothetical protein